MEYNIEALIIYQNEQHTYYLTSYSQNPKGEKNK